MNDWIDYKGSGSARAYANDVIAHKSNAGTVIDETLYKQREAYDKLSKALLDKAFKQLDELETVHESAMNISNTIRKKTKEDKNYNTNGLLQRMKTYLVKQSTINAELDKTINEITKTREKMWTEIGYTPLELLSNGTLNPDRSIESDLRHIKSVQTRILNRSHNFYNH